MTEVRWLSDDEQRAWRAFLTGSQLLMHQLGRELQNEHGLTHNDYEILVRLSEAPDRQLRMTDLAEICLLSKSRLSHQITRMEEAGLVARASCPTDRRGAFAVLTDDGMRRLENAAPDHVETVRRHFIDQLSPEELEVVGRTLGRVADLLQKPDEQRQA